MAQAVAKLDEKAFQAWYTQRARPLGLDPNPDAPEHFYDYRAAYQAGAEPDETGHWPSEFKREGHPREFLPVGEDGAMVNTRTGETQFTDEYAAFGKRARTPLTALEEVAARAGAIQDPPTPRTGLEEVQARANAPTTGERVQGFGANLLRGAESVASGVFLETPAILGRKIAQAVLPADLEQRLRPEEDLPLNRLAAGAKKGLDSLVPQSVEQEPPGVGRFLTSTLPQGLGSTAGFVASGGAAGLTGAAIAGAASNGAAAWHEAKYSGASDETAWTAYLLNASIGVSEAAPLGKILDRITGGAGGSAIKAALLSGAEEWAQESGQQILGNVVAQNLYDEDRKTLEGVVESGGAGFLSGVLLSALGSGIGARRSGTADVPSAPGGPENAGDPLQNGLEPRAPTESPSTPAASNYAPDVTSTSPVRDLTGSAPPPNAADQALMDKLSDTEGAQITVSEPPSSDLQPTPNATNERAPTVMEELQAEAVKPAPYAASRAGLPQLFHETSPDMAVTLATASMDLAGLNVTPFEELALGQGGKGAVVEFQDLDQVEVRKAPPKPSTPLIEQTLGMSPEWEILTSTGSPKGLVKSITFAEGAKLTPKARAILKGHGWTKTTLDDGRTRYLPPQQATPVSEKRARLSDTHAEIGALLDEIGRASGTTTRSSGLDPEQLSRMTKLAGLYVKAGAQSIEVFASEAVERLGEAIRPYLQAAWDAARSSIQEESPQQVGPEAGSGRQGDAQGTPPSSTDQTPAAPDRVFDLPNETKGQAVRRKVQDYFARVRTVQQAVAEQGGVLDPKSDVYLAEELAGSQAAARIRFLRKTSLRTVAKAMATGKLSSEAVNLHLIARHAADRNALIAKRHPDTFTDTPGSGMSNEDAALILANDAASPQAAQFQAIEASVDRVNAARRDLLVQSGLLSAEEREAWEKEFGPFYVPLRTIADPEAVVEGGFGRGMTLKRPESQRAEGRTTLASDPLADTFAQMERTIARAAENRVRLALLEFIRANPDHALWEETAGPKTQDPNFQPADHVVPVKENGAVRLIALHDPLMARALKRLGIEQGGKLLNMARAAARVFSQINTSFDPSFIAANLAKDLQTAGVHLAGEQSAGMAARVVKGVPQSAKAVFRSRFNPEAQGVYERWYRELEEAGGTVGWYDMKSIADLQKEIDSTIREATGERRAHAARLVLHKFGELVEIANASVENALRLSAYVEARKSGVSIEKAASLSKNLTVNFNRKGEWSNITNTLWVFSNAGIQGSARMLSALRRSPAVRKIAVGIVTAGFLSAWMNRWLGGDDDEGVPNWDKVPEWEKAHNFIVLLPDGSVGAKFPLPWGYNVFHVFGTQLEAATLGKSPPTHALAQVMLAAADAFNPLGDNQDLLQMLSPTILDPVVQHAENKSFTGAPIKPEQSPFERVKKPESELYWPSVSPLARDTARVLNELTGGDKLRSGLVDISPEILEHWGRFFTGGAGRSYGQAASVVDRLARGEPIPLDTVPIVRRFVLVEDPRYEQRAFSRNFDLVETAAARQKEGLELTDDEARLVDLLVIARRLKRQISKLKKDGADESALGAQYRDLNRRVREALSVK